ncbi:MAG: FAD-dependent oxidoreductase [Bryobacteraceae bacterium]
MSPRVVVAGAGIIGSAIAWMLRRRGIAVTLLDNGPLPGQASGAGAGMLAPGAEVTQASPWSSLALDSAARYADFVAELKAAAASRGFVPTVDFRQSGAVEIAWDDEERRLLDLRSREQASIGIASRWLSHAEIAAHVPALDGEPRGALYYPRDAIVDPVDVVRLLHRIQPPVSAEVSAIEATARGVVVRTASEAIAREVIECDAAVLAAGAWASRIAVTVNGVPHRLAESVPVRGHLMGFQVEAGRLGPILRHAHTYLLQRRSGLLVAGTSEERVGFDAATDQSTVAAIRARAMRLIPRLIADAPYKSWIGFRPGIDASAPAIGQVEESRLWLAYGHYRNGILLAPATAHRIAQSISATLGMD